MISFMFIETITKIKIIELISKDHPSLGTQGMFFLNIILDNYHVRDGCFLSMNMIGMRAGVTRRSVRRWKRLLLDKDIIMSADRFRPNGSRTTCVLRINKKYTSSDYVKFERKKVTSKTRFNILKRDGFRCNICGKSSDDGIKLHVDHMLALTNGGDSSDENLWVLCEQCNLGKGTQTMSEGDEYA